MIVSRKRLIQFSSFYPPPCSSRMRGWRPMLSLHPSWLGRAVQLIGVLLYVLALAVPTYSEAAQKKCGAETCGTPTKTTKVINGVKHNCESTTCSKSCCTFDDPPVCSIEKTTTSSCTAARTVPGKQIPNLRGPSSTLKQQ